MIHPDPTPPSSPKPPRSPLMRWTRTLGVSAVLVAGLAVLAWVLLGRAPQPPALPADRLAVTANSVTLPRDDAAWKYVQLHPVHRGKPIHPLPVPGRIAVDESRATRVMAPLSGRIERVAVTIGQVVIEGDLIAVVRSGALVDLQAEQRLAETAVAAQSRNLARVRALVSAEAAPAKDLVSAQRDLAEAQVALEAARLKRRSLRVREEGAGVYELIAPRGGVVLQTEAAVGEEVGPDRTTPLVLIADLSEVTAIASVPEAEAGDLAIGQAADVTVTATGQRMRGKIDRISSVVDAERRTVDVRLRLSNAAGNLRPNAWIQVGFVASGPDRILVPSAAVVTDDQRSMVFAHSAGKFVPRDVVPGRQRDGWTEVQSGLQEGEVVAGQGALLLLNAIDLQR